MNFRPCILRKPSALVAVFLLGNWHCAHADSFTVSNLNDSGAGSLRQAISDANASAGADQITISPGVTGNIVFSSGEIAISSDLSLSGPGAEQLTLSGGSANRLFNIAAGTVSLSGLTLSGGKVVGTTGAAGAEGTPSNGTGRPGGAGGGAKGGAILNAGVLTLTNVTLSGNVAQGGVGGRGGGVFTAFESRNPGGGNGGTGGNGLGGAIYNSGTLTLTNSAAQNNKAIGGVGGAGGNGFGLMSSGPSGNGGDGGNGYGGAIFNAGTLIQSTNAFSGNQALGGAGGAGVKNPFNPNKPPTSSGKSGTGYGPDIYSAADQIPVTTSLTLSPEVPVPGNTIQAAATVNSGPGVTPTLSYSWTQTRAGVTTTLSETTANLATSAATAALGDVFTVTVIATNGTHSSAPQSASVIIGPAPVVKSVTLTPTYPQVGGTITATALADKVGTLTPTLSYSWTRVRGGVPVLLSTSGSTLLLTASNVSVGDVIKVSVVAQAAGLTSAAVNASVTVVSPPVVQTLTISPASPIVSSTLTATATTTQIGTLTPTLSYTWTRTRDGAITPLDTKTATLPLSGISVFGDKFTVTTVASYGDVASASKSASVTVGETPVIKSVTLSPLYARIGDTVTVHTDVSYAGNVAPTLSYIWFSKKDNSEQFLDETSSTLKISADDFAEGDQIVVYVSAHLGGLTDYGQAEGTTIVSTPIIKSLNLSPNAPLAGQDLTATVTATTGVVTPTLTYAWKRTRGGVTTTLDATTATLSTAGDVSSPGDVFTVAVIASYGDLSSEPQSASVTIGPAPLVKSVTLSPSAPYVGDTLSAVAKVSGTGSKDPVLSYAWTRTRNGITTPLDSTASTLATADASLAAGDVITVSVTAAYGDLKSEPQSASVTLASNLSIQSLSLTPQQPFTNDSITATATVVAPAGKTAALSYVWTRTRKSVTSTLKETGATLSTVGDTASVGDLINVTVMASDGQHQSAPQSASVTIANSPISLTSFTLQPKTPYTFERMIATVKTSDLDKTPPLYSFTWTKNGVVTQTETNSRSSQSFYDLTQPGKGDKGDTIEVTVTASDMVGAGATTVSARASATIRNSVPVLSLLTLSPGSPTPKQTIVSTYGGRDADRDSLSKIYGWKIGKKVLSAEHSSRLDLSKYPFVKPGDVVTLEMRLSDGESLSKTVSASVTVVAVPAKTSSPDPSAPAS